MTVTVVPSGNMWRVTYNGATKSNHRKKSRAKARARKLAKRKGTTLQIRGKKGRILETRSYTLSRSGAGPG